MRIAIIGMGLIGGSLARSIKLNTDHEVYASDIDLCGLNTAAKSADLFRRLQSLKPDALVLGGDYTSPSLLDVLNQAGGSEIGRGALNARDDFFRALSGFKAPLGKFAICTPDDPELKDLKRSMEAAGITPLFDTSAAMKANGESVYLAGLTGEPAPIAEAARAAKRDDCVIAVAASPTQVTQIMINEVEGGDLTGESDPEAILDALLAKFPNSRVVLTLGEQGSVYADAGQRVRQAAFHAAAVDTTAAGDTFTGYFLSALMAGKDIPYALKLASRASAITVSRPGAAKSIPMLDEVLAVLE